MIEIETQVSLTAFGHPPSWVTAVIIEQTPPQRLGRALAGLGTFWTLALGGLFIPVAHFILVPTFVVAGIVVAVKRARGSPAAPDSRGLPALRRCAGVQAGRPLRHRPLRRLPEVSWNPDAGNRRDRCVIMLADPVSGSCEMRGSGQPICVSTARTDLGRGHP